MTEALGLSEPHLQGGANANAEPTEGRWGRSGGSNGHLQGTRRFSEHCTCYVLSPFIFFFFF